jgi:tRNA-dihydrouridine synthase
MPQHLEARITITLLNYLSGSYSGLRPENCLEPYRFKIKLGANNESHREYMPIWSASFYPRITIGVQINGGGTLNNRSRFVMEVFREMRKTVGEDFPVGIKMNSADFMKSGFTTEDSVEVAKALEEEGIDLIEISSGTYESPRMMGSRTKASTRKREAYFLEYAEELKKQIDVPIVVTGGFRSGSIMQDALESGRTDMIGLARPLAIEPDFPDKLLNDIETRSTLKDPTTGFAYIDKMTMLSITWYEYQLAKLANSKKVNPNQSAWSAVFQTLSRLGVHGFLRRRA